MLARASAPAAVELRCPFCCSELLWWLQVLRQVMHCCCAVVPGTPHRSLSVLFKNPMLHMKWEVAVSVFGNFDDRVLVRPNANLSGSHLECEQAIPHKRTAHTNQQACGWKSPTKRHGFAGLLSSAP